MTVTYKWNLFLALFHWKGSVWKVIWIPMLIWLITYFTFRVVLYFIVFKSVTDKYYSYVMMFASHISKIPLEMIISFYVNQAITRWWAQISIMPWPDEIMAHVCSVLYQNDNDTKSKRRTVGRYIIISIIMAYRNISTQAVRLYPNLNKLQECGLITSEEKEILEHSEHEDLQYEIPVNWIHEILRSKLDSAQSSLVFALNSYRNQLRNLTHYNTTPFPLVYTQTATIAVYALFTFAYMGNIFLEWDGGYFTVIPFVTILRFIYTVGWLKVVEEMSLPFGDDDDDVDLTEWFKRHIRLVYTVTDYATLNVPQNSWMKDNSSYAKVLEQFPSYVDHQKNNSNISRFFKKIFSMLNFKAEKSF